MQDRALDNPLEPDCWLGVRLFVLFEHGHMLIEKHL